ncbi:SHOCT domain-containing protein [Hymenobacter arizonensis]|nr:SHOCT domain-containing protein [Hymenobacter arizonensis]
MENPSSPLDTLRQLKEMLDAGALTPTEFEALKKRLVFADQATNSPSPASPPPAAAPSPPTNISPPTPPASAPPASTPATPVPPTPVTPAPADYPSFTAASLPPTPATPFPPASAAPAPSGYEPPVARAFEPPAARPQQVITELNSPGLSGAPPKNEEGPNPPTTTQSPVATPPRPAPTPLSQLIVESLNKVPSGSRPVSATPPNPVVPPTPVASAPPRSPEVNRVPPQVPPQPLPSAAPVADEEGWADNEFPESDRPKARSPLALILSIGGLLALLGLVVYLALNRPPSERLSSTSQIAADSVATTIETGPQADPLTPAAVAEPETIRVMPTNPAPPVQRRPAPPRRDTVAVAPAAPVSSDSTDTP